MAGVRACVVALVAAVLLPAATSYASARPTASEQRPQLLDVPYLTQTEDLCGGAAVAMVLRYWGARQIFPEDFAPLVDRTAGGIRTEVLVDDVRRRGWQAFPFDASATTSGGWIEAELGRGRPIVALIEVRPGVFHYVVIVGWTSEEVVVHDPARAQYRVLSVAEFERAWARARHWALLILPADSALASDSGRDGLPGPAAAELRAAGQPGNPSRLASGARTASGTGACTNLVQQSIDRAQAGDFPAAESGLVAASRFCPSDASPWRELAGLRFIQSRWADASLLAARAARLDRNDAHTWELLGTSRFLNDEFGDALDAWNNIDRPLTDLTNVQGALRTRSSVVASVLSLPPRSLLTANAFLRAGHRLAALPAAEVTRLRYRPLESGIAEIDAVIAERPLVPKGIVRILATAGRTLIMRELRVDVASATGSGELWSAGWRWWANRPSVSFALALPAPPHFPGVLTIEGDWGRQSYATPNDGVREDVAPLLIEDHRHASLALSDWATGRLRWSAGGALDRWTDRNHLSGNVSLERRFAGDRVSVTIAGARWQPIEAGQGFGRMDLSAGWRSTRSTVGYLWSASAGLTAVSLAAPLDLWPGAGTGYARAPLLRAHPLLNDGVLDGAAFGRQLSYGSTEYQYPLPVLLRGALRIAAFADAAKAWHRLGADDTAPLHVDIGTGLRVAVPGMAGTLRVDIARGLRDGQVAWSAGWMVKEF